jgi:hypothetical protein
MIAGNPRQRRPVDALGRDALPGVGTLDAESPFVTCSCFLPQASELRLARGIQTFNGQDRDVAVLRVDPGERRV